MIHKCYAKVSPVPSYSSAQTTPPRPSLYAKLSFRPQGGTAFSSTPTRASLRTGVVIPHTPNCHSDRREEPAFSPTAARSLTFSQPATGKFVPQMRQQRHTNFHSPQLNRFSYASPEDSDSAGRLPEIVIPSEAEGPAFSRALRGRTFRSTAKTSKPAALTPKAAAPGGRRRTHDPWPTGGPACCGEF